MRCRRAGSVALKTLLGGDFRQRFVFRSFSPLSSQCHTGGIVRCYVCVYERQAKSKKDTSVIERQEPRAFSPTLRNSAYLAADGVCLACGDDLSITGMHADHRIAWSQGGSTTPQNLAALCPKCNLKKGILPPEAYHTPVPKPMKIFTPRKWQNEALAKWDKPTDQSSFMLVATPGAGKTSFALDAARQGIQRGDWQRIVVIVPSDQLRHQWGNEADRFGIPLQTDWKPGFKRSSKDFFGIITTYQGLAEEAIVHATWCGVPTLVILDECHHLADTARWGTSAAYAFKDAKRQLLLSGTPFRTDGLSIPFAHYDEKDSIIANYRFGYAEALAAGKVVRRVIFPRVGGEVRFRADGKNRIVRFDEELSLIDSSRRLKTSLVSEEWLRATITEANKKLLAVRRNGHPHAGGLIACVDKKHAHRVGALVRDITGTAPAVVVSEDPGANSKINAFRNNNETWVVAVRMIAEGVDIKRLRVGIYAATITTPMFLHQFFGRFVRWETHYHITDGQISEIFIPDDDRIVSTAGQMAAESNEYERRRNVEENGTGEAGPRNFDPDNAFIPLGATPEHCGVTTPHGANFSDEEMKKALQLCTQGGFPESQAILYAQQIRDGIITPNIQPPPPTEEVVLTTMERRDILRRQITEAVNQCAGITRESPETINRTLKSRFDGITRDNADLDGLSARIDLLIQWCEAQAVENPLRQSAA